MLFEELIDYPFYGVRILHQYIEMLPDIPLADTCTSQFLNMNAAFHNLHIKLLRADLKEK